VSDDQLKPCPFCGYDGEELMIEHGKRNCWVECPCGARGPAQFYYDKPAKQALETVVIDWNGRD